MIFNIIRLIFLAMGLALGYVSVDFLRKVNFLMLKDGEPLSIFVYIFVSFLFGLIFFLLSPKVIKSIRKLVKRIEVELQKIPMIQVLFGTIGLLIGLFIASLLSKPFYEIDFPLVGVLISVVLYSIFGYLGMRLPAKKSEDILALFSSLKDDIKDVNKAKTKKSSAYPKILDTSVIIDGRIADICKTGFVEGPLVIPNFVLGELQSIADSSNDLKRNRGRRGLDILNIIQKELDIEVIINEEEFRNIKEVDAKLLKLTQKLDGKILTNDYNLNKVAEVQNIPVLNINDLANAVKPVVLPGEEMEVQVVKDGKEVGQGLAYLDDGTMIVVEKGKPHIGKTIEVIVTSVLQTSAGRMIFARPAN